MLPDDHDMQIVKNNKEDSLALAKHAREMTSKLLEVLKTRNDLDSLKPTLEQFAELVVQVFISARLTRVYVWQNFEKLSKVCTKTG
jgi:hypothetical protein